MPKLKVYRTTIGFHDAYVAVPSRAAALRAWGASTDLFAMGAAEEVTEPALMKKPLADPGIVIKQARGSAADHIAASSASPGRKAASNKVSRKPPAPTPSRAELDRAEASLTDAEAAYERAKGTYEAEDAAITKRRQTERWKYESKIDDLREARDGAEENYRAQVDRWQSDTE